MAETEMIEKLNKGDRTELFSHQAFYIKANERLRKLSCSKVLDKIPNVTFRRDDA